MDLRKVNDSVSVAPQIAPEEMAEIAAAGFRTLICNRPDGEDPFQPEFDAVRAAAEAHGMAVEFIPVSGGAFPAQDIIAFRDALEQHPAPALAYCRSGTRSVTLWALSQAGHLDAEEILSSAGEAGYDLSPLAAHLNSA